MGKKSSKAPDYSQLAGVSREAIAAQKEIAGRQLDFTEQQYADLKPLFDSIVNQQLAAQQQQMEQGADYFSFLKDTYRPLEEQIVSDAQRFSSDSYAQLMASDAAAASARAFGNVQGALARSDAARGLNPNSPAARAARQQAMLGLSAQQAGAMTGARDRARTQGQAYLASAAGLGRNLPGASTAAYQGATMAGSAAGANAMAPGNQYMQGLGMAGQTQLGGYQAGIGGLGQVANLQTQVYGADQSRAGAIFGGLMGLGGAALGASNFSDRRLKEDITFHHYDQNLDLNFYEFSYINTPDRRFIGVMADEVAEMYPQAVHETDDGYLMVDYGELGARMIEVTKEAMA